jgi:hypothetical protein
MYNEPFYSQYSADFCIVKNEVVFRTPGSIYCFTILLARLFGSMSTTVVLGYPQSLHFYLTMILTDKTTGSVIHCFDTRLSLQKN